MPTLRVALLIACVLAPRAFAEVPPPNADPAQQRQFTTCATLDARQALWVGTEGNGLFRFDPATGAWKPFTRADGLGDNSIYALATDTKNRLWVGHLNHGVSVYNGQAWRNYDATDGPLGHRVFAIAVSPLDANVWIATELGLTRYAPKSDAWSYVTRADGLPADDVTSLAFTKKGDLFVGTACDGIALAHAADDYKTWKLIDGPDRPEPKHNGIGMPGRQINCLLVTHDGLIFAGTKSGLARSGDGGNTWAYFRGREYWDKLEGGTAGVGEVHRGGDALLAEDFVTCLAEDAAGRLWVGYRREYYTVHDEQSLQQLATGSDDQDAVGTKVDYAAVLLPHLGGPVLVGTYGHGLRTVEPELPIPPRDADPPAPPADPTVAPLPSPAKPPTAEQVKQLAARVAAVQPNGLSAAYLGADWATQGDGFGRYGRAGAFFPSVEPLGAVPGVTFEARVGPHVIPNSPGVYTYFREASTTDPRAPYNPLLGLRRFTEWNDGSFSVPNYPVTFEGPDLWLKVALPDGTFRVSIHFANNDGHTADNRFRDHLVEVKPFTDQFEAADAAPPLARCRVHQHYGGVYEQFLLAGGDAYWIKIHRDYSHCTKAFALYVDRLDGDASHDGPPHPTLASYAPPPTPASGGADAPRQLIDALDAKWDQEGVAPMQLPYRLLAYRAAAAAQRADAASLRRWRWTLNLWTDDDREEWCKQLDAGWAAHVADHPEADQPDRVPLLTRWQQRNDKPEPQEATP